MTTLRRSAVGWAKARGNASGLAHSVGAPLPTLVGGPVSDRVGNIARQPCSTPAPRQSILPTLRKESIGGFTLIEALVATALMATILAALATITAQWLPNWNRGIGRVQRSDHLALALDRVVSDLAAARYIPADRNSALPVFDGADRSITFVRTPLAPNAPPGLEIVRIAEIDDDGAPALLRSCTAFAPGMLARSGSLNFSDPVVLVRGPYRVSFAYAGRDRVWRNAWHEEKQLPRAIKLTLSDPADRRVLIASTATLVHADIPGGCIHSKSVVECFTSRRGSIPSAEADEPSSDADRSRTQ
jgi:general secretion pathway protein J